MGTNDQNFGQVRHWLSTNISVKEDGALLILSSSPNDISPYVGPAPLPNYISPRPHRYVFILARPSSSRTEQVSVTKEDLQKLQEHYRASFEGAQMEDVQDLKDRWGFNAQKFLEMKGLKVEAATFMLVGGTLKSAAANMVMSGQAIVNKVSSIRLKHQNCTSLFMNRLWANDYYLLVDLLGHRIGLKSAPYQNFYYVETTKLFAILVFQP